MRNKINLKLIVNRVHSADEGRRIAERIMTIVGQFLNYKVEYLGFIYDDPTVMSSVIRQKPFMIVSPSSKPAICIKHIIGKIEKTGKALKPRAFDLQHLTASLMRLCCDRIACA